jgi:uncharacterized protein (DUF1499 family)
MQYFAYHCAEPDPPDASTLASTVRSAKGIPQIERNTEVTTRACRPLAWIALGVASICAALELLAGPGYRLGWWPLGTGIQTMRWAATAALAAGAMALAATLCAARFGTRRSVLLGLAGIVLALAAAGPPFYLGWKVGRLPHIHDISTDTVNPPRFVAVLPLRAGAPNSTEYDAAVATEQREGYPDIAPLLLDVPPARAFERAQRVADSMGWDVVAIAPQAMRIEATATTLLFGFKDDVVIRVAAQGSGSRVDMRSLSRVGGSDFGVNAERVRDYLRRLATARDGDR